FLQTDYDMQAMISGIRLVRKISQQPALKPYVTEELQPTLAVESDADMAAFVRNLGYSNLHPVGTCRMGADQESVVDPQLRVRGIAQLRIADASIMPTITSGLSLI
ncbi:choline dehydrogenase, partial [Mycobacterium tuberculosis]|nr:choline dehydrogenase [Mycobacterium tuberculosis]